MASIFDELNCYINISSDKITFGKEFKPTIQYNLISQIDRYIINQNATIIFWKDGTKTIVKKMKDEPFNKELAFLTAYFQKTSGLSKNKANKYLSELVVEEINNKPTKEKSSITSGKYKFKIGDRVKAIIGNLKVEVGSTGTIAENSDVPFVKWDNGGFWAIDEEKLEKIEEDK